MAAIQVPRPFHRPGWVYEEKVQAVVGKPAGREDERLAVDQLLEHVAAHPQPAASGGPCRAHTGSRRP